MLIKLRKILYRSKNPDINKYWVYPKFFLSVMGCWPVIKSPYRWVYLIPQVLFAHFYSICFTSSLLINFFLGLENMTTEALTDAMVVMATQVVCSIKLTLLIKNRHRYEKMLLNLNNPLFYRTRPEHEPLVRKWIDNSNFHSRNYLFTVMVCVIGFSLYPLLDEKTLTPCVGWFPFDYLNSKILFTVVYIFQAFAIAVNGAITGSLDLLPTVLISIGCGQVELLKFDLEHAIEDSCKVVALKNKTEIEDVDDKNKVVDCNYFKPLTQEEEDVLVPILTKCVQHHEAIIRLFYEIQHVFNRSILVQFLSCSITLCGTAFQLIVNPWTSAKFFIMIGYFCVLLLQVSLYTINGNHVIVETATIIDSCYKMEWYRCSSKVKKMLMIIMERCKKSNILTAGGVFELSNSTLTVLLRSAHSFFTLMNGMNNK